MAMRKTSLNLADAVAVMKSNPNVNQTGDFFLVLNTFDFGRDVNGNKINKYRATLHRGDLVSVQNNYTGCTSVEVLTSPRRREQSYNEGADMALHWLERIGYDLAYESMTIQSPHSKKESYRLVYHIKNNWLKAENK